MSERESRDIAHWIGHVLHGGHPPIGVISKPTLRHRAVRRKIVQLGDAGALKGCRKILAMQRSSHPTRSIPGGRACSYRTRPSPGVTNVLLVLNGGLWVMTFLTMRGVI